jgi:hypothetical protein
VGELQKWHDERTMAAPAVVLLDAVNKTSGPTSATPYWELITMTSSSVSIALATVGGIISLTKSHVCDADENDDVGVCCGRYAPPPMIALVCLFIGMSMAVTLVLDRVWAEPRLRGLRFRLQKLSGAEDSGSKRPAYDTFCTVRATIDSVAPWRVSSTIWRLKWVAGGQMAVSVVFFVVLISMVFALGSAICVSGNIGTVGRCVNASNTLYLHCWHVATGFQGVIRGSAVHSHKQHCSAAMKLVSLWSDPHAVSVDASQQEPILILLPIAPVSRTAPLVI